MNGAGEGAVVSFLLPDLGEGLTDAEIVEWLVAVGDPVAVDQPVAEVETAKAAVQVPCPFSGTVAELHGEPGDTVAVGTPLISVGTAAEDTGALAEE
ncbi:biotin/lipoyl-containing protein, partial [Streptomonospora algeriensis]